MIGKILITGFFVQGVFFHCAGLESGVPDDVVALLQTQAEVKKAEARTSENVPAAQETADYGLDYMECNKPKAIPEVMQAAEASPLQSVGATTQSDAGEAKAPKATLPLGTVLEAMACLIFMDVMRRCCSKGKTSKTTAAQTHTKNSTPSAPPPSLLTATLAGDDKSFEAQINSCLSQLSRVDSWGCSVLHYAAKGGSVHIIKRLLDLGARVNALDAWDETPLHLAARAGHAQACATLLAAGADVNATNAEECTPLVVAGRDHKEAVCTLLIDRGASVADLPQEEVPDLVIRLLQDNS